MAEADFNPSMEYIGGFFDGEGSVSITRGMKSSKNDWRLQVNISQLVENAQLLFWLRERYGGYIGIRSFKHLGPHRRDVAAWNVTLRKAERFLKDIEPYVFIKKPQVQLGLLMMANRRPQARPWKYQEGAWAGDQYAQEMRALNGRHTAYSKNYGEE